MIFTETKILVHFYKKFQDIIILFHDFSRLSMTLAVFQDFPGLENGLTKFQDFPGRVVTLLDVLFVLINATALHRALLVLQWDTHGT